MNACIFILSYNRALHQDTVKLLQKHNTKISYYIVIDDQDLELELYKEKYDNILIYNKERAIEELNIDLCDNFQEYVTATISRNMCFKFAKELGYDYFIELDGDYQYLDGRYESNNKLCSMIIHDYF